MLSLSEGFRLLGLDRSSQHTVKEVESAFRRKALECHPDRHPGDPGAEERFKTLCVGFQKVKAMVGGENVDDPDGVASWRFEDWKEFFASVFEGSKIEKEREFLRKRLQEDQQEQRDEKKRGKADASQLSFVETLQVEGMEEEKRAGTMDLSTYSVSELKLYCRKHGLPSRGRKVDLVRTVGEHELPETSSAVQRR